MTDKYNTLTVVLENDIRDDEAEPILAAIRQLKGVLTVEGNVADAAAHMSEVRARHVLGQKLWNVIQTVK